MSLNCFKAPSLYNKNRHWNSQLKSRRALVSVIALKEEMKKGKVNRHKKSTMKNGKKKFSKNKSCSLKLSEVRQKHRVWEFSVCECVHVCVSGFKTG